MCHCNTVNTHDDTQLCQAKDIGVLVDPLWQNFVLCFTQFRNWQLDLLNSILLQCCNNMVQKICIYANTSIWSVLCTELKMVLWYFLCPIVATESSPLGDLHQVQRLGPCRVPQVERVLSQTHCTSNDLVFKIEVWTLKVFLVNGSWIHWTKNPGHDSGSRSIAAMPRCRKYLCRWFFPCFVVVFTVCCALSEPMQKCLWHYLPPICAHLLTFYKQSECPVKAHQRMLNRFEQDSPLSEPWFFSHCTEKITFVNHSSVVVEAKINTEMFVDCRITCVLLSCLIPVV